ncbi:MAG: histidine--tRNA ligase [Planctomycetota bacterium]
MIQPRTLKGFRDYLPESMIPREGLMETARRVYRSYGFVPIETPVLEYSEILCGKGSEETDRQMFRFEDHGGRDVGMRFDLTVPLARFVAQHSNDLGMPFKRYHIANVWRGEKPQVGRYREFMQCDFDTIGTTSVASDVETALVIFDLMNAIGFEDSFQIRVNNRKILNGVLQKCGLSDKSVEVLRALDKLAKIGREKCEQEMANTSGASAGQIEQIMQLAGINGPSSEVLAALEPVCGGNELAEEGLSQLRELISATQAAGVGEDSLKIDVSIARGLDYYTGTIYETFLNELPDIGSVCSGGRYDNLAGLYTKQALPGIGASLGLDRLLAAMQKLEMIPPARTTADVLIVQFDSSLLNEYLKLAAALRKQGLSVEVYPEAKKPKAQFKYADRRLFRAVIVIGEDEFAAGKAQVKNMDDGSQTELPLTADGAEVATFVKELISGS